MVDFNTDIDAYTSKYKESISNPVNFWLTAAKDISWIRKPTKSLEGSFSDPTNISWFEDGTLNVYDNCVERHLETKKDKPAIIWKNKDLTKTRTYTYGELNDEVQYVSRVFTELGLQTNEAVAIYMPLIPEGIFTMLSCAKLGLPHCVVFGGFGTESLRERALSVGAKMVITVKKAVRGPKVIDYERIARKAFAETEVKVLFYDHETSKISDDTKIFEFTDSVVIPSVERKAEDLLFVLHTSGSTGKPKAIMHRTGGYLVYANQTFKQIFNYKEEEVFFCTADIGWITGHSYVVYGPLSAGATICVYEGIPTYPDFDSFWKIIDEVGVTILYTAPTALKVLKSDLQESYKKYYLKSLRVLGSVGEILDVDTWNWYYKEIGKSKCPIVDTWWQTETGGIAISTQAYITSHYPGSCAHPFFGIEPKLVDVDGDKGKLVIAKPWPGMMQGLLGDEKRFLDTYFPTKEGYYSGDYAKKNDGIFTVLGRYDDSINISGHLVSTREVENIICEIASIDDACVVGMKHAIKGQTMCCFYVAHEIKNDVITTLLREKLGPIMKIDAFIRVPALPRTRSGKTMRRIMKTSINGQKISSTNCETLANPESVVCILDAIDQAKKDDPDLFEY
jgi:acetyl-CoA synthetase